MNPYYSHGRKTLNGLVGTGPYGGVECGVPIVPYICSISHHTNKNKSIDASYVIHNVPMALSGKSMFHT